jgi:hypothetical protein
MSEVFFFFFFTCVLHLTNCNSCLLVVNCNVDKLYWSISDCNCMAEDQQLLAKARISPPWTESCGRHVLATFIYFYLNFHNSTAVFLFVNLPQVFLPKFSTNPFVCLFVCLFVFLFVCELHSMKASISLQVA